MNETKQLLKRARQLWNSGDRQIDRHNRKAWVRSITMLGSSWIMHKSQPTVKWGLK